MTRVLRFALVVGTLVLGAAVLVPLHGQNPIQVFFGTAPWASNSGNTSAATGRVVIATDQPQLTTAWKVDGSAVVQPVSGTVTGNAGTGAAAWGHGSTGAAPPAGATQAGFVTGDATAGGHLKAPSYCDATATDRSSTADVELVPLTSSQTIYICGYTITGESTTASDVNVRYGTGTTCLTGSTNLTPPITIGTGTSGGMIAGVMQAPGLWSGLKGAASNAVCVHRSAAQTSEVLIWYTKF